MIFNKTLIRLLDLIKVIFRYLSGVDVLLNKESKRETPSVVTFTAKQRMMGTSAGMCLKCLLFLGVLFMPLYARLTGLLERFFESDLPLIFCSWSSRDEPAKHNKSIETIDGQDL